MELLLTCLDDAFDLGYRQIAISGGEPLLYPAIGDLLAHARAVGMTTSVTSNGMLATDSRWRPIASLVDVVAISIDGNPTKHDAIRCREGAFARTIANLEAIRSSGVPFGFIFTLTQHNVDNLEFVVRLAAEQGARSVQVHPLTLHGRAATALPGSRPDGVELLAALLEAARLGSELDVVVHVDALTIEQLFEYRDWIVPERPVAKLINVAPILIVEADASVLPLTHELSRTLLLGSLADARLASLADNWLAAGLGERLADVCARTWDDLTGVHAAPAFYWYDELAARSHETTDVLPHRIGPFHNHKWL